MYRENDFVYVSTDFSFVCPFYNREHDYSSTLYGFLSKHVSQFIVPKK